MLVLLYVSFVNSSFGLLVVVMNVLQFLVFIFSKDDSQSPLQALALLSKVASYSRLLSFLRNICSFKIPTHVTLSSRTAHKPALTSHTIIETFESSC